MAESESPPAPVSVRVLRYGVDAPLPERRTLRAGPVTAVLEGGDLRYVAVNGVEVIRRLYMAVRNQNWDTIEPRYTSFEVEDGGDRFAVRFTAEHVKSDVDFAWSGTISGAPDGTIRYEMEGAPRRRFLRNRIGFCVLHPMDLAGLPATVETPSGRVEGSFPERISPHQPFFDMLSISHAAGPAARVTIRFEGDLFEMEDQRNWTDASYKTYSTPLRIPYPVQVEAGQRIVQAVTLTVEGSPVGPTVRADGQVDAQVGTTPTATLPAIGFVAAPHGEPLSAEQIDRLRLLRPAHLHVDLDLRGEGWATRLDQAAADAGALGAGLELSVVADAGGGGFERLADALLDLGAAVARVFVFPPTVEPVVLPRTDLDSDRETLGRARAALQAAGIAAPVGGGTRAYFTELNRAADRLPLDLMDVATYTINPQIHAFDNLSLVETLAAQTTTVESARAIVGNVPLAIGPVTLRPPFNPHAKGPIPEPGPAELPPEVDARQLSLFGAGWTVGSLHRLAQPGVASLTYYETVGWRGVMERAGGLTHRTLFPSRPEQLFPPYHVFAALAAVAGAAVLPVSLADPLSLEVLALRSGNRIRLLVASFADAPRSVVVEVGGLTGASVRFLDERNASEAMETPTLVAAEGGAAAPVENGRLRLELAPFAIARVDGTLTSRPPATGR